MGEPQRTQVGSAVPGVLAGSMIGGVVGLVSGSFPVFAWELWALPVFLLAAGAGAIAGALVGRHGVGFATAVAGVPIGGLFAFTAIKASVDEQLPPDDAWGIPIWGTVAVVAAGFMAAVIVSVGTRFMSGRASREVD